MCSLSLWSLYKKGSADVCRVTSLPERCRVWPIGIMTGLYTALIIRQYHIPSVAPTWNGSVRCGSCGCTEAPQVPKQTDKVTTGLADFLEEQFLPNTESLGPVLLGFHIWWC